MENPICPLTKMICQYEKTIKVTDVANGKATESFQLCQDCAANYLKNGKPAEEPEIQIELIGIDGEKLFFKEIIVKSSDELFELLSGKGLNVEPIMKRDPCPNCGLTIEEFNHIGRYGCAECYTHFMEEFLALAGPFQDGADQHQGKIPKKAQGSGNALLDRLKLLKLRFAKAVEVEKYEEAALIKVELDEVAKLYDQSL